jgi:Uma2 family endonuclease
MRASHCTFDGNSSEPITFETRHQIVSLKLASALLVYAEQKNPGYVLQAPCRLIIERKYVIQPDIVFLKQNRSWLIGEKGLWGAPDLIIEIMSPDTREQDRQLKRKLYSRFGVGEYWIVDPDTEMVEVLAWSEMGYATAGRYRKTDPLSSPTLPGFSLPLQKVFTNLRWPANVEPRKRPRHTARLPDPAWFQHILPVGQPSSVCLSRPRQSPRISQRIRPDASALNTHLPVSDFRRRR